jgi:hypothetical protein
VETRRQRREAAEQQTREARLREEERRLGQERFQQQLAEEEDREIRRRNREYRILQIRSQLDQLRMREPRMTEEYIRNFPDELLPRQIAVEMRLPNGRRHTRILVISEGMDSEESEESEIVRRMGRVGRVMMSCESSFRHEG